MEKVKWETPSVHLVCHEGLFLPRWLVGVMQNAVEAVGFGAAGARAGIAGCKV